MTPLADAAAPSNYESWYRHFQENRSMERFPWHGSYMLTAAERRAVGRSIQQFQLGEWARGRGLKQRAASHVVLGADPWFLPALELFIEEEQRHSEMLGMFLDHQSIPRLKRHWVDGAFRRLRKMAGLEVCSAVLVSAEVLAIPFYQALRDATRSALLRSICVQILMDEASHLNYQGLTLGLIRRRLSGKGRALHSLFHAVFFHATAVLLWQQHRSVFRAAGWSFGRFWSEARLWFAVLQLRIRQVAMNPDCPQFAARLRLD